jgi:hypothetical protein
MIRVTGGTILRATNAAALAEIKKGSRAVSRLVT